MKLDFFASFLKLMSVLPSKIVCISHFAKLGIVRLCSTIISKFEIKQQCNNKNIEREMFLRVKKVTFSLVGVWRGPLL